MHFLLFLGPEFLIASRSPDGGCMKAAPVSGSSTNMIVVSNQCDISDKNQSWVWVSSKSIKNVATEQCLAFSNNTVTLRNCDTSTRTQRWRYIDRSSMIQLYDRSGSYIKKSGISIIMDSSRDLNSKWIAKVKEGGTSMKNMRCE